MSCFVYFPFSNARFRRTHTHINVIENYTVSLTLRHTRTYAFLAVSTCLATRWHVDFVLTPTLFCVYWQSGYPVSIGKLLLNLEPGSTGKLPQELNPDFDWRTPVKILLHQLTPAEQSLTRERVVKILRGSQEGTSIAWKTSSVRRGVFSNWRILTGVLLFMDLKPERRPMADRLAYSVNTLAEVTDISKSQIKKAIYNGDLAARKNGYVWLILAEDARAFLEALPRPRMKKARESSESLATTA